MKLCFSLHPLCLSQLIPITRLLIVIFFVLNDLDLYFKVTVISLEIS